MSESGFARRAVEKSRVGQVLAQVWQRTPVKWRSPDYPRLVCVETTNHCNATCTFCPNNALARDKGPMAQDLFEKIIEDCREFPLETIEPFMQGDPFSDPDILPRLEHIKRRLPTTRIKLYTNGNAMTPARIDALAEIGLDQLFISVNTLNPEKYRQVMGLRLDRTLRNLEYLVEGKRKERVARKITFRMTRLADTTMQEQNDFIAYAKKSGVEPFIVGLFNYKGDINGDLPVPRYGCEHVSRLDILASGRVTLYCMDQDAEYSWGDVNHHSVLAVYRGKIASRYRELHRSGRRREIEPCGQCNMFWPDFRETTPPERIRAAIEAGVYFVRHRPTGRKAAPQRVVSSPEVGDSA